MILCCGNIAFDLISKGKKQEPTLDFSARPGGSVFNTAILLSRLGLRVSLLAKTGTDFLSKNLCHIMLKEKLNTKNIVYNKNIKPGLAIAKINKKGDSSYIFYKTQGKITAFSKKEIPSSIFNNIKAFHTASAFSYNNFTFENTLSLMQQAKKKNILISYDPNWRENRIKNKKMARIRIKKLLRYVDLLKLSEQDALGITSSKTLSSALKKLPQKVVITLGGKGSFFYKNKKRIFCPAFKIPLVDTIGAGDGFTAGLLFRYCVQKKQGPLDITKEDLVFASAVSALICGGTGATENLHNLFQVQRFLKKYNR
ncbi:MAG: carbohydrate kinase [Candidatus Omnitrophota bacterium]